MWQDVCAFGPHYPAKMIAYIVVDGGSQRKAGIVTLIVCAINGPIEIIVEPFTAHKVRLFYGITLRIDIFR